MNETEQRKSAQAFAERWKDKGNEEQHKQDYWKELLNDVFGINEYGYLEFEKPVPMLEDGKKTTKFIDVYIPSVKALIEQKGIAFDLDTPEQRGKSKVTPFEQAKRYNDWLPHNEKARWLITSNFETIRIYDTNNIIAKPVEIQLAELPDRFHELDFLVDDKITKIRQEAKISEDAGRLVGLLYDALKKMYAEPDAPETLHGLNVLMVRLVFLLYAEDAGLLQAHNAFGDFVASYRPENLRSGLKDLFAILDTPTADREPDDPEKLLAFPYINGGLFSNSQKIRIPQFSDEAYNILLNKMSYEMDWKAISPTIFGMVFESTLDSKMRHAGGMHYTSLENIHKILDNLFLNDLRAELDEIKGISIRKIDGSRNTPSLNAKNARLDAFREKLSKIHILDPAAGSGNFLTESYLSLRKLENEAIKERYNSEMFLGGLENPIKVSINQMHGIEINDFAVSVAKTALWIAEAQMYEETRVLVSIDEEFLPLHSNSNMIEGNALQMDWNTVCNKNQLTYIIGNPPFLGYTQQTAEQKQDLRLVHPDSKNIDYVSGWYFKAAEFIQGTQIRVAFVSTNSITQGEQVQSVWQPIFNKYGVHIDFAFRTFVWESASADAAAVHVVIVAFSSGASYKDKFIFNEKERKQAKNISPYLIDTPNIFINKRTLPISTVPKMHRGSQPTDNGQFIFTEEEYNSFLSKNPDAAFLFRPFMMGKDFIDRKPRYCLWLADIEPAKLKKFPEIINRIQNIKDFRLQSTKASTRKKAETPMLFDENQQPDTDYVALPVVSSENRRYIPIDYLSRNIIAGNKLFIIEESTLYHFGILTSNVHMSWMRTVAGRLKSDYSYSNTIVYNNFPWPEPSDQQRQKIEATAKAILDARANHPDASLADLYDTLLMPADLRKAHQENDKAVMEAYGFRKDISESECVAELFRLYQDLTKEK